MKVHSFKPYPLPSPHICSPYLVRLIFQDERILPSSHSSSLTQPLPSPSFLSSSGTHSPPSSLLPSPSTQPLPSPSHLLSFPSLSSPTCPPPPTPSPSHPSSHHMRPSAAPPHTPSCRCTDQRNAVLRPDPVSEGLECAFKFVPLEHRCKYPLPSLPTHSC